MIEEHDVSQIVDKADNIIKDHNGVYLEKRLYKELKKAFPTLSRNDFKEVISQLLQNNYSMEHGLIRQLKGKESGKIPKFVDNKKSGKKDKETTLIPNKRGL